MARQHRNSLLSRSVLTDREWPISQPVTVLMVEVDMRALAGWLLIVEGAGHLLLAVSLGGHRFWRAIASAGWWNAVAMVPESAAARDRALGFWSTAGSFAGLSVLLGALIVTPGALIAPPWWLGAGLIAYGLFTASLAPRGGFWGFLVPGTLLVAAALHP